MGGDPLQNAGRPLHHAAVERHELQIALMGRYRKERFYQNAVNIDLKRLWRKFLSATSSLPPSKIAGSQPEEEFMQMMYKTLRAMRLLLNGEPAVWAFSYVLADVKRAASGVPEKIEDPELHPALPVDQAHLLIELAPDSASVEISYANEEATAYERARRDIPATGLLDFDQWERLRLEAHTLIDDWIEVQRRNWKERPDYQYRNKTYGGMTLGERQQQEIAELFDVLFNGRPFGRIEQRKLKRLCETIGLDLPKN